MTLSPVIPFEVFFTRLSKPSLASLCLAIENFMLRAITTASKAVQATNINAMEGFTTAAITQAPTTIKGDLKRSLKKRFIPVCIWLTSDVRSVTIPEDPIFS